MPVSRVIIKILKSLGFFSVATILILRHGDKSAGIYLYRKSHTVLHVIEKGGEGNRLE